MPRPPRFEFPGAIYHVLNRGNYRAWVFEDDGAKASFQKCLFEACEFAGWTLHAYCVMGNHYHMAIETPEPRGLYLIIDMLARCGHWFRHAATFAI
ncbi:MAG: transposase [Mycobacterium sp.]|nr:transposase [Mycobacterium sp.]